MDATARTFGRCACAALAVLLGVSFAACSAGAGNNTDPPHAGAAAAAAQPTAATPSTGTSATAADDDVGDSLPAGTLTWKIVLTGHLPEANVSGPDVTIAKSQTDVHWVIKGSARLSGSFEQGELDPSGEDLGPLSQSPKSIASVAQRAVDKCGQDTACMVAARKVFTDRLSADAERLYRWEDDDSPCKITISGDETSDWHGGARFASSTAPGGIVTIAFKAHETMGAKPAVACASDQTAQTRLRADKVSRVYNLALPALRVATNHTTQFTTSAPQTGFHKAGSIEFPALIVRGVPFPKFPHTLHGERVLHGVASMPAVARTVRLPGRRGDMYAVAAKRPSIPLDADVTWTFTPDGR